MRVVAVVLCAGCWSATDTPPIAPTPTNEVIVSAPSGGTYTVAPSRIPFPLHSVWEGTYVCSQGLSSVTLTIDAQRNGTATAQYDFGPTPSNTSVPKGSYLMSGTIRSTRSGFSAELEPGDWILHPPTYLSVSLVVETTGRDMKGAIQHPNCRDFEAHRID
jgi:hypothetical protein